MFHHQFLRQSLNASDVGLQLRRAPSSVHVTLRRLLDDQVLKIAFECLRVNHIPEALARLILYKAHGSPLACREFCAALLDSNAVRADRHRCVLSHSIGVALDHSGFAAPRAGGGGGGSSAGRLLGCVPETSAIMALDQRMASIF